MKKFLIILILVIGVFIYDWTRDVYYYSDSSNSSNYDSISIKNSDSVLQNAFKNGLHDLQVEGVGTVIKLLPDDNVGSRHQKFIIKLSSGQTLLISHNIDLAPSIDDLSYGDLVEFNGEYEWNPKGGVIHWTHKDPRGYHVDGWLKHNGKIYQ